MSYMRGETYIWGGGDYTSFNHAGKGVNIPQVRVDAFVLMRMARMTEAELSLAVEYVKEKCQGNFGADELLERYGMKPALDLLKELMERFPAKPKQS